MSRSNGYGLLITLMLLLALPLAAQKTKPQQKPGRKTAVTQKPKSVRTEQPPASKSAPATNGGEDEKKVRDMVAFLQYVLNTLGDENTSSRDKDVLITESYSKIFRDANVQVEDDLDEDREISTNKNVVAYLKDVDFFYQNVKFEFDIESIEKGENASNHTFYKVSLKRNLRGTTTDGKQINNTIPRFIEINYNPEQQDLKIASIYTHAIDERAALMNWWKALSLEWQTIFREKLAGTRENASLPDTLDANSVQDITSIQTLDLSHNEYIQNIEPLARMTSLQNLNLSKTHVTDLTPIRNLTELVDLDLSDTHVSDLSALKYSSKLSRLDISRTDVTDLSVLAGMPGLDRLDVSFTKISDYGPAGAQTKLTQLNLSHTGIRNLAFISGLNMLTDLDVTATTIEDLGPLKSFTSLATLTIDSTRVTSLAALSGLSSLKILRASQTGISDLGPLQKLPRLERIYCDKTGVNRQSADAFMASNPKVLVVFDTEDMTSWWNTLSGEWQQVFVAATRIAPNPSKEELARIPGIDSINLSDTHIGDLDPLRKLLKLKTLLAAHSSVTDVSALRDLRELQVIDISETDVTDISPLDDLNKLRVFKADKSKIQSIHAFYGIKSLQLLYADQTALHDITAQEFLEKNPHCLLIFKTIHLNRWWKRLPPGWKEVFFAQWKGDTATTRENLHRLVELESFQVKESQVSDLSALSEFVRLKELHITGTAVADLSPLTAHKFLKILQASSSPIQRVDVLRQMTTLVDLDISNTPVDELKPLEALVALKKLNCSGTQVKKLDPLRDLPVLEYLDCSNTRVGNLEQVSRRSLKTLKCYNTKVSAREVDNFKKANPECQVVYYR